MAIALKYAEMAAAVKQVGAELYGRELDAITGEKEAAFRRYLGSCGREQEMASTLVLTADQVAQAVRADMTVAAIRDVMVEGIDALGGFLAPETFHTATLDRMAAMSVVRPRATVLPAMSDSLRIPRATGGTSRYSGAARVTWVSEQPASGAAASSLAFGAYRVPVYTAMVTIDMSRPLFEDGGDLLAGHAERILADAFAVDEDGRGLNGSGAGSPRGILADGVNDLALTEVNSGAATALTTRGIIDLPFAVAPQYRRGGRACWVMATSTIKAVAELVDGAGRPLLSFEGTSDGAGRPMLQGFPVEEVADGTLPAIAAGAYPIIFGALSGYVLADRLGMSVQVVDDAATAQRNVVCLVARRRVGGTVAETYKFATMKIAA